MASPRSGASPSGEGARPSVGAPAAAVEQSLALAADLFDVPTTMVESVVFGTWNVSAGREASEEALRTSRRRYRTLVERFPDGGVFLFDDDLMCVLAGGAGLSAVQFSTDEIEGAKPHELYPPGIANEQAVHFRATLAGKSGNTGAGSAFPSCSGLWRRSMGLSMWRAKRGMGRASLCGCRCRPGPRGTRSGVVGRWA